MTVTFGAVELKDASKLTPKFSTLTADKLLITGRHKIKKSTEYGTSMTFECLGTYADVTAIRAKIGVADTLTTDWETFTNMVITGDIEPEETENPLNFIYRVSFVQDTSL